MWLHFCLLSAMWLIHNGRVSPCLGGCRTMKVFWLLIPSHEGRMDLTSVCTDSDFLSLWSFMFDWKELCLLRKWRMSRKLNSCNPRCVAIPLKASKSISTYFGSCNLPENHTRGRTHTQDANTLCVARGNQGSEFLSLFLGSWHVVHTFFIQNLKYQL